MGSKFVIVRVKIRPVNVNGHTSAKVLVTRRLQQQQNFIKAQADKFIQIFFHPHVVKKKRDGRSADYRRFLLY